MPTQHIETTRGGASDIQKKLGIVGLVILPIALAAYGNNGLSVQAIPSVLTSGVFPIGFTILAWGYAAKIGLKLRK